MRTAAQCVAVLVLVGMLGTSVFVVPARAQGNSLDVLQAQIAALLQEIGSLQRQLAVLTGVQQPSGVLFTQTLARGSTGAEVRSLQSFLASLPGIYPEGLVTGYFGPLTEAAVRRFQAQEGIQTLGVVGPQTRAALNALRAQSNGPAANVQEPVSAAENVEAFSIAPYPAYDFTLLARLVSEGINAERTSRGLGALAPNSTLSHVAQRHSGDVAEDNRPLTEPKKACTSPFLRHEGFTFGFKVSDRVRNFIPRFSAVGENIVTFAVTKDVQYRVAEGERIACPGLISTVENKDALTPAALEAAYQNSIAWKAGELAKLPDREIVNRAWMSEDEIAEKAVRLWMGSDSHRETLLEPRFREAGVGVAVVNDYLVITQVFVER